MTAALPHITNAQMSAHMVRALLWKRKFQTRRIPAVKWNKVKRGSWIYVREHWRTLAMFDDLAPRDLRAGTTIQYDAGLGVSLPFEVAGKHRQAMHMPRWASRIALRVTGVNQENLQLISHDEAISEGLGCVTKDGDLYKYGLPEADKMPGETGWHWREWDGSPINAFAKLWDSLHGDKPGEAWADNPIVLAIRFEVVQANIERVFPALQEGGAG